MYQAYLILVITVKQRCLFLILCDDQSELRVVSEETRLRHKNVLITWHTERIKWRNSYLKYCQRDKKS